MMFANFFPARSPVYSYKLVRGALDFGGVVNRATSRSRYGYDFVT